MNKKIISVFIALSLISAVWPFSAVRGGADSAVSYLKTKNPSPWITLALAAAGETPSADYLKSFSGAKAIDYEAPILALAAAGKNPRTFSSEDFVQKLKSFYNAGQIGEATALNDDIFGILALLAAGEPVGDAIIQGSKSFILQNQNSDGGWPFAAAATSDTNTTAAAVMALLESGLTGSDSAVASAVQYLKGSQNSDGGFPYDPHSSWGTASDASSDAWVISAITKLGESPQAWVKDGHNPVEHLATLQTASGYFEYQPGSGEDAFSPVTTAYAVVALAGKYYPLGAGAAVVPSQAQVGYKIEGSAGAVCAGEIAATDALELVENAAAICGFSYHIQETSFGLYLDKIGADEAGGSLGWLYAVNFETPAVGAAVYQLEDGDYVIWHFGDFSWQPEKAAELDLTVNIVGAPAGSGNNNNEAISFSVSPAAGGQKLDFGEASPGTIKPQNVTITNQSQDAIYIESAVTGDSVFKNYLKVAGVSWRDFGVNLPGGESQNAAVELNLPASFAGSGTKSGRLIFWAAPSQ